MIYLNQTHNRNKILNSTPYYNRIIIVATLYARKFNLLTALIFANMILYTLR